MTENQAGLTETEKKQVKNDLLYLCVCALHGFVPDLERIAKMNLPFVYQFSRVQELSAMAYMALETADLPESPLLNTWREEKEKSVRKSILQELAEAEVEKWMDESSIWYLPLKGALLKTLYPKPGMRQMVDVDILFDPTYRKTVRDWFAEHGYTVEAYKQGHHDLYTKNPAILFEMHVSLYTELHKDGWASYYENVRNRLKPVPKKGMRLEFSAEDFYVFMISHVYKHYQSQGIGLRALFDTYIYLSAHWASWDGHYVKSQLRALGIYGFETSLRKAAEKLCAAPLDDPWESLSARESELMRDFLGTSAHGTLEQQVQKELEKSSSKWKYLLRRMFPPMSYYSAYYPFFYRFKILLPFCLIYRAFRGLFVSRKRVTEEMKTLKNVK